MPAVAVLGPLMNQQRGSREGMGQGWAPEPCCNKSWHLLNASNVLGTTQSSQNPARKVLVHRPAVDEKMG